MPANLRGEEHDDVDDVGAGEREFRFRDGALVVRAYEDFLAAAIGGVITTAAVDLSRFCAETAPDGAWRGSTVVELGAGCALVSGTLVQLGASRVVATDQEQFLGHLEWNLGLNAAAGGSHAVEALEWTDDVSRKRIREVLGEAGADMMVAANCVYHRDAVGPFLAACDACAGPTCAIFMCGVPQPPKSDALQESILDAFLHAAPSSFDCYFLLPPALAKAVAAAEACSAIGDDRGAKTKGDDRGPIANNDSVRISDAHPGAGVVQALVSKHGVSGKALADGIWLMMPQGVDPPDWASPLFRLDRGDCSLSDIRPS